MRTTTTTAPRGRARRAALALLALGALVPAACSAGDGTTAPPTTTISTAVDAAASSAVAGGETAEVSAAPADDVVSSSGDGAVTSSDATDGIQGATTTQTAAPGAGGSTSTSTGSAGAASSATATAGGNGSTAGAGATGSAPAASSTGATGTAAAPRSGGRATQVDVQHIYGPGGYPAPIWDITDHTADGPAGCYAGSGAIYDGAGYVCGSSAQSGTACTPNPLAADEVICIYDPLSHTGGRMKAALPLPAPVTPDRSTPLVVELTDGTRWDLRSGGTGLQSPEGLAVYYWCSHGDCGQDALWGGQGVPALDRSGDTWIARRAAQGEMSRKVEVARVWYVEP